MHRTIHTLVACLFTAFPAAVIGQNVIHVDADATGVNDGTSWQDAFNDLQDGIALGTAGTQIWVAEGTYHPAGPGGERTASFVLRPGVEIYGGFLGNESSIEERPTPLGVTALSGDLLGNDGDEISLDDTTRAENSFHVVKCSESDSKTASILDGFVVTGGNANGSPSPSELKAQGGGIQCVERSLQSANLLVTKNSAGSGGGLYASGSDITVRWSTFRENVAGGGGGMRLLLARASLDSVGFYSNEASQEGGGLSADNTDLFATNLVAARNRARGGGGILTRNGIQWIINATVIGNEAWSGGGIDCARSTMVLVNGLINGNSATGRGMLPGYGGGLYIAGCSLLGVNLTVVHNRAVTDGAAAVIALGEQLLVNSIFWGNEADNNGREFSDDGMGNPKPPTATLSYSVVKGDFPPHLIDGGNNSTEEPLFTDAVGADGVAGTDDDNLRQARASPHLDTGSNDALPADSLDLDKDGDRFEPLPIDLDGNPRLADGGSGQAQVDLGAYEFGAVSNRSEPRQMAPIDVPSLDINVYPNPFRDRAWVEVKSTLHDYVTVTLFDVLGRPAATLFSGPSTPFEHKRLDIPLHLPAGSYVLVARGERSLTSLRLTKVSK